MSAEQESSPRTYIVVLRAQSAARFKPEQGQEVIMSNIPDVHGNLRMRLRTRWVDEGHDAPFPRELWIEAFGESDSLDQIVSASTATARLLATVLAFSANAMVGMPEVHIAYETTTGGSEREFLEVFLPDEKGLPKEGYLVNPDECNVVYIALSRSDYAERVSRALYQYELALRYWYFGGEWLSLAHLYMAVEALTIPALRRECRDREIDEAELARINEIDPDDPDRPRWRPVLEAWCRASIIFSGDSATYQAAKSASDGVEHGFMDLNEINKKAMVATEATFGYVRRTILRLLEVPAEDYGDLTSRVPHDVQSLRKMIRGHFLGEGDDLAALGEEYPRLEWHSSVKTLSRKEDVFSASFEESFTVRAAEGLSFRGKSLELKGRKEAGRPVHASEPIELKASPPKVDFALLSRANRFASAVAAPGEQGVPTLKFLAYSRFAEIISLHEAIHALLLVRRPVEAMVLLHNMVSGACVLQVIAVNLEQRDGLLVRIKLDAIARQQSVFSSDAAAVERLGKSAAQLQAKLEAESSQVASESPNPRLASFYAEHKGTFHLIEEVAHTDDLAMALHTEKDGQGNPSFRTQLVDSKLARGVAGLAVKSLTVATIAFAEILGWPYDAAVAEELQSAAESLLED